MSEVAKPSWESPPNQWKAGMVCPFCRGTHKRKTGRRTYPNGPDGPKGPIVDEIKPCDFCTEDGKFKAGIRMMVDGPAYSGPINT